MSFYGEPVTVSSTHPELLNQVVIDLRQFIVGGEPLESGPHLRLDFDAALEFGACYLGFWRVMGDALAHRFLLLHGGAVCSPPGATRNDPASSEPAAVLFIGPGGSGKTTLVLAATRLGWEPMGDDVVALEWQTGRLFAVSAPYRVRPDTRL
ncbi:MAG TPA: hypothetical protein PLI95_19375, partial [Polyangiaceae bacterium]|nr:hypothetical protein [Polyangiaceae bacterium]